MAARTVSDDAPCCKNCPRYSRVSLTYEFCGLHGQPILGEDTSCRDRPDSSPWLGWVLTAPSLAATKGARENLR